MVGTEFKPLFRIISFHILEPGLSPSGPTLLTQLAADLPWKAGDLGLSAWVTAPQWGSQMELVAPDSSLAWPGLLQDLEAKTSGYKICLLFK